MVRTGLRTTIRLAIIAAVLSILGVQICSAEVFSYKYTAGTKYKIVSQSTEQVYVNNQYDHTSDFLEKISVDVAKTKDGSGYLNAHFVTSERAYGAQSVYHWTDESYSKFWRNARGIVKVDPTYLQPNVRDVPQFPDRNIQVGETWSLPGEEIHNLQPNFHLAQPLRFPITVSYTYLGNKTIDGQQYEHLAIDYPIFYKITEYDGNPQMHPVRVSGYSHEQLLWDNAAGRPYSYSEKFDLIFDFSTGDMVEYIGTAQAKVVSSPPMDRNKIAEDIRKSLSNSGVKDTQVAPVSNGVTISLQRIQFQPDSAVLLPSEKKKLDAIGKILEKYPNRDILITGHTALAGTAAGRKQLSLERAQAVGNYLLSIGARKQSQITVKGVGAADPIASNNTEAGREKNRRVEITILEN